MITIHVALVRYGEGDHVDRGTFLRVAAALQVQLTRDFTPIWGTPAVVSPFESLEDVPPACIPLLIVKPGTLDPRFHGFHVTEGEQVIGLVEAQRDWSLAASHELLEIVCDPSGERKVLGESLRDSAGPGELTTLARRYRSLQGEVSYLIEVCDPCQAAEFAYTVDGVLVLDFVTPRYYAPQSTSLGSYSFTGAVTKALQVLRGGYLSWYTSIKGAVTNLAGEQKQQRQLERRPARDPYAGLRPASRRPVYRPRQRRETCHPGEGPRQEVGVGEEVG